MSVLEVGGSIEYSLTEGNSTSSLEIMFSVAFRLLLLGDAEGLVDGKVISICINRAGDFIMHRCFPSSLNDSHPQSSPSRFASAVTGFQAP